MKKKLGFLAFTLMFLMMPPQAIANDVDEEFVVLSDQKLEIWGEDAPNQFGFSMISGDYNGDGIDDLIVGAPYTSSLGYKWNGGIYIIFGSEEISGASLNVLDSNPIIVLGSGDNHHLGAKMASGDLNNDGFDDLLLSAVNGDSVYILLGNANLTTVSDSDVLSVADFVISAPENSDYFGKDVEVYDLNEDGFDDVLIGAPRGNEGIGMVYGYLGSNEVVMSSPDISFRGFDVGEDFGSSIAVGNAQGITVAISAPLAAGYRGKVYIYRNIFESSENSKYDYVIEDLIESSEVWSNYELNFSDLDYNGVEDLLLTRFGYVDSHGKHGVFKFNLSSILSEDKSILSLEDAELRLDGFDREIYASDIEFYGQEVFLGAPLTGKVEGTGEILMLDSSLNLQKYIYGENNGDWFGFDLEILDINHNGKPDLAVGSRYSDSENTTDVGKVFILMDEEWQKADTEEDFEEEEEEEEIDEDGFISRGRLTHEINNQFDLKNKKKNFLDGCYQTIDFCTFTFVAQTNYIVSLESEILLYPDVSPDYEYYDDITVGTLLGYVNGYIEDENSPFRPERNISRIEALKVVLGAADLVPPMYRFELIEALGSYEELLIQTSYFEDVNTYISHMWWYPRYLNFGVDAGIIDKTVDFRPDDDITVSELDDMIERTKSHMEASI